MPPKYDKHFNRIDGNRDDPATRKELREKMEAARAKIDEKRRFRQFKAEPEELAVLDALERMPEVQRGPAAEAALIARVARRKKLIK